LTSLTCVDPTNDSIASGSLASVNVAPGETVKCTFRNTQQASIGDWVWQDVKPGATTTPLFLAGDGLQNDPAEKGVAGITVELWSPGGDGVIGGGDVLVDTTTTDANGKYFFGAVMPDQYYLLFTNSTGSGAWSTNFQVGSNPTIDSDVNVDVADPTRASTELLTLGAGDNDLTWDAAIVSTSSFRSSDLGDRVWDDANRNGIQDPGEMGKPGIVVRLYLVVETGASGASVNDTLVATDTTDSNGIYGFQALDPGTYYIVVQVPTNFTVSPEFSGSNPAVDSNINPAGRSGNVVLPEFTVDSTIDAGMYETPTVDPIPNEPGTNRLYLPTVIK
jgi:protocatechuate 3,4-dioxygenase beta subunit